MRPAVFAMLVPVLVSAQSPGHPRLVLDADQFDFGKLSRGRIVSHRIKATNTGDAVLNILRLDSSCGCTTTVAGKLRLEPGESTELVVTFNSAGLHGPSHKSVRIVTDDPVAPERTLTFSAEVGKDLTVSDRELFFQDLTAADRRKATVKIESGTASPVSVIDVELSEAPWLGVATREEGQILYVDLELLARDLPPGRVSGTDTITLKVGNPAPSTVVLKATWEKRLPVKATPGRVSWAGSAGRDLAATVVLAHGEDQPFRILSARTSNPLLRVLPFSPGPAARHELRLVLAGSAPAGTYDEKVIVALDTPAAPELQIRVAAVLR